MPIRNDFRSATSYDDVFERLICDGDADNGNRNSSIPPDYILLDTAHIRGFDAFVHLPRSFRGLHFASLSTVENEVRFHSIM